jgi:hypothetical protein
VPGDRRWRPREVELGQTMVAILGLSRGLSTRTRQGRPTCDGPSTTGMGGSSQGPPSSLPVYGAIEWRPAGTKSLRVEIRWSRTG